MDDSRASGTSIDWVANGGAEGAMDKKKEERSVEDTFGERFEDFRKRMSDKTLNIAVIGKVGSGKSSLINALLGCERHAPVAPVGAKAGVTTEVHFHDLSDRVCIVDTPGLDDLVSQNSEKTASFLSDVKIGILVVTGNADKSQYGLYEKLQKRTKRAFVVLNKCDEWDDLEDAARDDVIAQWRDALKVPKIYPTRTKGYDPQFRKGAAMHLEGIVELRGAIFEFLGSEDGVALLFESVMKDKRPAAIAIIAGACASVGLEALVPGPPGVGSILITATQASAIAALYYLYTQKFLSKTESLAMLPAFLGQMAGKSLFLFLESLLPPTFILDLAAAAVAITVTLPILLAVNSVLAHGAGLEDRVKLQEAFAKYRREVPAALGKPSKEWATTAYWEERLRKLMYA
jgi:small GTP-binding protein